MCNKIIVLLFMSCIYYDADSQVESNPKSILLGAIEELNRNSQPKGDSLYYMNTEIKTIVANNLSEPTIINIEAVYSSNLKVYKTDLVSVFQDTTVCYVLSKKNRTIYIHDNKDANMATHNKLINQQKEFINLSEFISEKQYVENGIKYSDYSFKPSEALKNNKGYELIIYKFNHSERRISGLRVRFKKDYRIVSQFINYKNIDFNYDRSVYTGPARYLIFNSKGRLKKQYENYKVIDTRV
ncbi:hypothetical protein [Saccharicrinis aurantiacus]|uniref:hypothetical protein n=1 Tax=Saccharicrinis aurantiacus TaxID=1849719 RepID=UPI0008382878|nr:hypothetical protein [Saccharicrinis aurantiacus]